MHECLSSLRIQGKAYNIMNYLMSINRAKAWPNKDSKADVLSHIAWPHFRLELIAEGAIVI